MTLSTFSCNTSSCNSWLGPYSPQPPRYLMQQLSQNASNLNLTSLKYLHDNMVATTSSQQGKYYSFYKYFELKLFFILYQQGMPCRDKLPGPNAPLPGEGIVYPCEVCHKTFDKYKNLFRHLKTHQVRHLSYSFCNLSAIFSSFLLLHFPILTLTSAGREASQMPSVRKDLHQNKHSEGPH